MFKFVKTPTPRDLVDVEGSRISPLFLPPLSSLTRLNLDLEKAKQTQLKDTSVEIMQAVSSPKHITAHISPLHITFSVYQYYIAPLARPFVSYLSLCMYQTPFNY